MKKISKISFYLKSKECTPKNEQNHSKCNSIKLEKVCKPFQVVPFSKTGGNSEQLSRGL